MYGELPYEKPYADDLPGLGRAVLFALLVGAASGALAVAALGTAWAFGGWVLDRLVG